MEEEKNIEKTFLVAKVEAFHHNVSRNIFVDSHNKWLSLNSNIFSVVKIAASITLVIGTVYLLSKTKTVDIDLNQQLEQHYQIFDDLTITRGIDAPQYDIMAFYREQNYDAFISEFSAIENPTQSEIFYASQIFLNHNNLAEYHSAINRLEEGGIYDRIIPWYNLVALSRSVDSSNTRLINMICEYHSHWYNAEKLKKLKLSICK